ncbi:MAG: cellulose synthase family protein, partial [Bacteroidota bacterium]
MAWIIIMLYGAALGIILFYGLFQFTLISHARKYKRKSETTQHPVLNIEQPQNVPFVTVQLPVYNEYYVVERLIDAVASLHYPKERLEIQVLDDSTDDTYDIIKRKVKEIQQSEINIKHLYRNDRIGYKAGALQYGLNQAEGEFIAIFDADFVPEPDFLINTLPQFDNEQVGMVQTRWGHINENYSLLTRMQAFGLNAHFKIEQTGRYHGGRFLNFNGTGGVWRKSCIEDAGGWQHDTIAEDLDLSYRAQLKGWKFVYLDHVEAPAELPVVISGLKSQQFRWTKGG